MNTELVDTDWLDEARHIMRGQTIPEIGRNIKRGGDLERVQQRNRVQLEFEEIRRLGSGVDEGTLAAQRELESVKLREKLDDVINYDNISRSKV